MAELKEKRLAFLKETIEFYSADVSRRATNEFAACSYKTEDGRKCAIGRHIPDDRYRRSMEAQPVNSSMVFDYLPVEIKELGSSFLRDVQVLHDNSDYWHSVRGQGLTLAGRQRVTQIQENRTIGDTFYIRITSPVYPTS